MINHTPTDTTEEAAELDQEIDQFELDQIKKKSVSGATSYFIRTIFLNVIGIATAFVLSGYLTPADFGVYGYVTQFIGLLVFFSDIGLAASLVQKKDEPELIDYQTAFTIQFVLSILILIATGGIAVTGIVQRTVGEVGIWLLLALGVSFPLATLKTVSSIMLERKLLFSKLVLPQIAEQLVFNGLLVWLAIKGMGVMSYTYAILGRSIIGVIVMFIIKPWPIGIAFNKSSAKALLNFGAKFQLNDFLARLKDNLFFIVIARFMTPTQFGYISWSKQWSMYPYNLTVQNVMAITFPTFSRLQNNKQALKRAIEKSIFFITLTIFPILVGMSIFVIPLVQVVERYHKWQPAVLSLVLFSLGIGWSAISTPLTNTLNAIGQINTTLKLMLMWTALTWILTPIALYFYGFNGVAVASFVIAFTSLVPMYYVKKIVAINIWDNVWPQLAGAMIMGSVGWIGLPLWNNNWLMMLAGMLITGCVYIFFTGILGYRKIWSEIKSLR
jgi:O-antigen/teichoic acid export membrane protein